MALIAAVLLVFQFVDAGRRGAHAVDRYETLEPQVRVVVQICAADRDVGQAPGPRDPADCPDNCCLIGGGSPISAVVPEIGSAWPIVPTDGIRRASGSNERRLTRISGWGSAWSASGPPF
ncbi:hypothetical protein [Methylosinus sp. LW4]|uniref:hypothetical protein n=1 Tax=Methylosinus sp. LW4 TaxID=136993 RepID=UPI00035CE79A|nr:hypothetical protein [Methylosinus sp. LW4]